MFKHITSVLLIGWLLMDSASAKQLTIKNDKLQQIDRQANVLRSTGTDGFIIFEDQHINISELAGIEFEFELAKPIVKPELFELFWKTDDTGFNEVQKAIFFITPNRLGAEPQTHYAFYLPLDTLYNFNGYHLNEINDRVFTGLRLDFPAKENFQITLKKAALIMLNALPSDPEVEILEPYERMSLHSKGKLSALTHKLSIGFDFGIKRFFDDTLFAIFWLFSLFVVVALLLLSLSCFRRA